MKKTLLFSITLLGLSVQANAQLVELYNPGTSSENLSQYKIGLKNDVDAAWALPSYTVPANGHVIIYCDKEATGMHADFRLDSGKGKLFLFKAGAVTDMFDNIKK